MTPRSRFSHFMLARRHPIEWARFVRFQTRLVGGDGIVHVTIEHDDDCRCCQIEPWAVTMVLALAGDDGVAAQPDRGAAGHQREPGRPR